MLARASIAVSAGPDFVVEGAVNLVLFRPEDGSQITKQEVSRAMEDGAAFQSLLGHVADFLEPFARVSEWL